MAATPQNETRLIWIDLEMTGLDTSQDSILEIATVVTDAQMEILAEGPELAIQYTSCGRFRSNEACRPSSRAYHPEHLAGLAGRRRGVDVQQILGQA